MPAPSNPRSFATRQDGAILPLVAISLAVFLGLVALSFDLGRTASTQSELQSFADHVALAAAGELDGNAGARARAEIAAENLIADTQTFGDGGADLTAADFTLAFFSALPASDLDAMTAVATSDANAAYVRVTVDPRTVQYTFARAFNALTGRDGPNEANVGAVAVAGFTQYACDISPLMFCVPSAAQNEGLPFRAQDEVGTMVHLRGGGGNTQWGPGNWGWLSPAGGIPLDPDGPCAQIQGSDQAARREACLLASQSGGGITACFEQRGVDLSPGQQVGTMENALNVRFDRYAGVLHPQGRTNPAYAPAPNIIQGRRETTTGQCNWEEYDDPANPETVALPRDTCLINGTCARGRVGDGNFDLSEYIATNYDDVPDWHVNNPNLTRYQIYLAEIAAAGGGDILNRTEPGRAQCAAPSSDPLRRVLIAAAVDCETNNIQGSATGIPVQEFVEVFLTEPVPGGSDREIYIEIIGSAGSAGNSGAQLVHDFVQLYR
jgi:hypothetical protein